MRSSARRLAWPALLALLASPAAAGEPQDPAGGIAAVLQPFVDRHAIAGAVTLVASRDKVLDLTAVGFADVAAKTPMRADTLFWIASQSKPVTAAALMMLVDEGKVDVDAPVAKYLPEFRGLMVAAERDAEHVLLRRPANPPAVRHILSHTSGMAFQSPMEKPTLDGLSLRDAVRSHALVPLQWEPGRRYQYSNAGINTAGRIIEVAGGMPYEEFLQKRLLGPLGMKDTTFWPAEEQLQRLAKAYKPDASRKALRETTITQLRYPLSDRRRGPVPAGGLFSTAADVARFCRMVLNGGTLDGKRFLSEAAVAQMTSKQTGEAVKDGYGLGWTVEGGGFGHGGAYGTDMWIDPKRGLITVFLVQHVGYPSDGKKCLGAFRKAAEELFGEQP